MSLKSKVEHLKHDEREGLPTAIHLLRVRNDRQARAALTEALESGNPDRIADAKTVVAACYEQITITALPPNEIEDLLKKHRPTPEQEKRGALYNPDTFKPALVAACVLDSDITEDDWAEYMTKGPMSFGESVALFNACWDVNYPPPDPWLPKEWTGTRS